MSLVLGFPYGVFGVRVPLMCLWCKGFPYSVFGVRVSPKVSLVLGFP